MKSLLVLFALAAASALEIDWTKVQPIEYFNHSWYHPTERLQPRILDGIQANVGQFPYQAVLLIEFELNAAFCGGSVLTENYILTAAHCVVGAKGGVAAMGVHSLQASDPAVQYGYFTADAIVAHAEYDQKNSRNDIATIRLAEPIEYTDRVQPVRLPASGDHSSFAGMDGTVSGFGRFSTSSQDRSGVLLYMKDVIITTQKCLELWENDEELISGQNICVSGEVRQAPCNGDSGGPLTVTENGETLQVGIASFAGYNCIGRPTVFARITHYLSWIEAHSDYSGGVQSTRISLVVLALAWCFHFIHKFGFRQ